METTTKAPLSPDELHELYEALGRAIDSGRIVPNTPDANWYVLMGARAIVSTMEIQARFADDR